MTTGNESSAKRRGTVTQNSQRRARAAIRQREQERARHLRDVQSAVAAALDGHAREQRALDDGHAKADRVIAAAETTAAKHRRDTDAAIARLRALGETRAAIAELTELSPARIREALQHARITDTESDAVPGPGSPNTPYSATHSPAASGQGE